MKDLNDKYMQKMIKDAKTQYVNFLKNIDSATLQKAREDVERYRLEIEKTVSRALSQYENDIQAVIESQNKQSKFREKSSPKIKGSIKFIMDKGWYPDIENFSIGTLIAVKEKTSTLSQLELDTAFMEYYESNMDDIENSVCKRHPVRAHLIKEAFRLHKEKNYIASVPLFLTQIDGCAYDIGQKSFFTRKNKKPSIAKEISSLPNIGEYVLSILLPIDSFQVIHYNTDERKNIQNNSHYLNRHTILHGESTEYDIAVNSYKSISLLLYISQAGEVIRRHKDKEKTNEQ